MAREIVSEASNVVKSYAARSKPLQKAAILLNSLSPEVTVEVSRGLTEREIKGLLPEMTRLPHSNSIETVAIVNEFFHIHRLWAVVGGQLSDSQEILRALERWASRNPRRLAKLLKESWLHPRI
jgi:flagellar motor switch protein FliG